MYHASWHTYPCTRLFWACSRSLFLSYQPSSVRILHDLLLKLLELLKGPRLELCKMTEVYISVWVGRPPARPEVKDVAIHDAEQDKEDGSLGRKTDTESLDVKSVSDEDESASVREGSRRRSRSNTSSPSSQTYRESSFYIDVPQLSDNGDYEHLSGYFTVLRILREVTRGRYLVKLKSGEVDLVSTPFCNFLKCCLYLSLLVLP